MMTTTKKQTAAETYAARAQECHQLIDSLKSRLEEHQGKQAADPRNWGFAGDLDYVIEQLAYVLAALGDRSAVDRHGFKY